MQLDDLARQGQPDAGPAVAARLAHVHLEEPLEEPFGHVGWEARPVVLHHDPDGVAQVVERDGHVPAFGSELERVGEQIDEDALHPLQVAVHHAAARGDQLEIDALAQRERLHLIAEAAQVLDEVVLGHLEPQPRLLQLGEVEEVADHLEQLHPAAEHHLESGALGGRDLAHFPMEEQLQGGEDHRQRRLEFVGDVGKELGLETVELLELLVGRFQVRGGALDGDLAGDRLPVGAEEQHLAGAGDDRGRDEERQVGELGEHRPGGPGDQIRDHERSDDRGVGEQHHLGRPDEEQPRGDDRERQPGVVGGREAPHEDGHQADAERAEQHVG